MSSGKKNRSNCYPIFLTLEGKQAVMRYCLENNILSIGQALNQCAMKYLHEKGYLRETEWQLLHHSRVMKTGEEFIKEKALRIERKIEEKRIETSTIILPADQEQLLERTYERVMSCKGELKQLGQFYKTYKERATQFVPHPKAERILEEFVKYERK